MGTPQSYIAFAPFGIGIMCAVTWMERVNDVYGWWVGARDTEFQTAYFRLEDFYTRRAPRFYASEGSDLYGGWRYCYTAKDPRLDKPLPIDDAVAHELDRLQDQFAAEWLFFEDDERAPQERVEYDKANFPLRAVNLRPTRLRRFDQSEPVWIHHSAHYDENVLRCLQRSWPLDYE